jgi:hypothetical protein
MKQRHSFINITVIFAHVNLLLTKPIKMGTHELKEILLRNGRRPIGKLTPIHLKDSERILYADIKNGRAYSYFMIDFKSRTIKEGHIYERYKRKVFGEYGFSPIRL